MPVHIDEPHATSSEWPDIPTFVVGAQSHEVSGIRRLARVELIDDVQTQQSMLGRHASNAVGSHFLLSTFTEYFQIKGAPTLGSILGMRAVRILLAKI